MEFVRQGYSSVLLGAFIAAIAQSTTFTINFRFNFTGFFHILVFPCLCVLSSYLFRRFYYPPFVNVKDRFSELPREVSFQILSDISIRDVARLATVSRHWRNLCLDLPGLILDWHSVVGFPGIGGHTRNCERYEQLYVNNVNQVLHMYRNNHSLKSFQLSCCVNSKTYRGDIDRWMNFVGANKGLQTLTLHFICYEIDRFYFRRYVEELYLLRDTFLSQFYHLKSLHLDSCILRLEKEFKLPNLSTLSLNNVVVEESQWQGVLSCSSIIDTLLLRNSKLPRKLCIGNAFPCLSILMIIGCSDLRELEVSAWKLQLFHFHTEEDLKCSFFGVPNLREVYLYPLEVSCTKDVLNNLAANVPSLEYLFIRGFHSLMHELPSSPTNLFYSVSRLRISMNIDDGNILMHIPHLLKCFPQLKELEMKLPEEPVCKKYEHPVPYAHTKLESIVIFELHVEYIPIAVYLLESAGVLNHMVVTKASKGLCGFENMYWYYDEQRYSDEERLVIQNALIGKASSTNAELIVE